MKLAKLNSQWRWLRCGEKTIHGQDFHCYPFGSARALEPVSHGGWSLTKDTVGMVLRHIDGPISIIGSDLRDKIALDPEQKIVVKRIPPFTCEAFDPEGKSLGFLNEYEFNDLRIQICRSSAEGYYMKYKGEEIPIDKSGRLQPWPEGFYDMIENQLSQLI